MMNLGRSGSWAASSLLTGRRRRDSKDASWHAPALPTPGTTHGGLRRAGRAVQRS